MWGRGATVVAGAYPLVGMSKLVLREAHQTARLTPNPLRCVDGSNVGFACVRLPATHSANASIIRGDPRDICGVLLSRAAGASNVVYQRFVEWVSAIAVAQGSVVVNEIGASLPATRIQGGMVVDVRKRLYVIHEAAADGAECVVVLNGLEWMCFPGVGKELGHEMEAFATVDGDGRPLYMFRVAAAMEAELLAAFAALGVEPEWMDEAEELE